MARLHIVACNDLVLFYIVPTVPYVQCQCGADSNNSTLPYKLVQIQEQYPYTCLWICSSASAKNLQGDSHHLSDVKGMPCMTVGHLCAAQVLQSAMAAHEPFMHPILLCIP